jgi:hypothetical protein
MAFTTLTLKNLVFEDKACIYAKNTLEQMLKKQSGKDGRESTSGEEPPPLGTSKPPGTKHLAAKTRRAPVANAVKGLHIGG